MEMKILGIDRSKQEAENGILLFKQKKIDTLIKQNYEDLNDPTLTYEKQKEIIRINEDLKKMNAALSSKLGTVTRKWPSAN